MAKFPAEESIGGTEKDRGSRRMQEIMCFPSINVLIQHQVRVVAVGMTIVIDDELEKSRLLYCKLECRTEAISIRDNPSRANLPGDTDSLPGVRETSTVD